MPQTIRNLLDSLVSIITIRYLLQSLTWSDSIKPNLEAGITIIRRKYEIQYMIFFLQKEGETKFTKACDWMFGKQYLDMDGKLAFSG